MCSLPYRLVETQGFRTFMACICPKWKAKNRYSVQKGIRSYREQMNTKIIDIIGSTNHVSLAVDLWTDRRLRSYLGVTAHFLNNNFENLLNG